MGAYTNVQTGDWAGWGTPMEAPCLVKIHSNKWRLYFNEHSGLNSVAIYWSESPNWGVGTWSTKQAITAPWIVAHPTILKIRDFSTMRNIYSAFHQDSKTLGTIVTGSTTQTIGTSSTTPVQFTTEEIDQLDGWILEKIQKYMCLLLAGTQLLDTLNLLILLEASVLWT